MKNALRFASRRFASPVISAALLAGIAGVASAQGYGPPPPPQGQYQGGQYQGGQNQGGQYRGEQNQGGSYWDNMPPNYSDIGRRGWQDGMQAARMDWEAHRPMDPYHERFYRRPPVPGPAREEYRNAFLRGYDAAMHRNRGWGWHDNGGWHDEHDDNWRNPR